MKIGSDADGGAVSSARAWTEELVYLRGAVTADQCASPHHQLPGLTFFPAAEGAGIDDRLRRTSRGI